MDRRDALRRRGGFSMDEEALRKHQEEAGRWLEAIDRHLDGRRFLVGDAISLADVVLACQMLVPWCAMLDDETKARFVHLGAHLDKLWRTPEIAVDVGPAVEALTKELAARRGKVEAT